MSGSKEKIISFKLEKSLADKLAAVPNKSEFIRSAILSAMDNTCPLCQGHGTLSTGQMEHWRRLESTHDIRQCGKCHEYHIVCAASAKEKSGCKR